MTNYSIIIPHFTREGTEMLKRAVASIPERDDIEVIVVDNSLNPIPTNLFDENKMVSILYSANSRGAGGARNEGLKKACGQWLLFMDADDFFTENAFDSFDKFLRSEYDVVFFKPTSCDTDTYELADRHYSFCDEIDAFLKTGVETGLRYSREFEVPWAKLIKRSLINENSIWFDEVPASNDVMFSLKVGLFAKKIIASSDVVYCVTMTPGSITNVVSLRNLESVFDVRIRKNQLLKSYGLKKECSVLNLIIKSSRYGVSVFLKFFHKAVVTGNLFVGYRRWLKTLINYKSVDSKYIEIK